MRNYIVLFLASPAAANPYCLLLPANAPGFEMRAVHTEENQWLAEIELVEWVEGEADAQTALGEMSAAGRPWRVLVLGYEKEVITAGGGGAPPLTEINLGEAPKRRK